MEYVIASVLVLIGIGVVTYPLFSQVNAGDYISAEEDDGAGGGERDAVYRELTDLEFEYHAGKVSEEDFRELTRAYRAKALALMELQDHKVQCMSCGSENRDRDSFCRLCGAALTTLGAGVTYDQGR